MPDGHVVGTTTQCVRLDQLDAADFGRSKAQNHVVRAIGQGARPRKDHGSLVRWKSARCCAANHPGLRQIHTLLGVIEQNEIAGFFRAVHMFGELGAHDGATLGLKSDFQHIRTDLNALFRYSRSSSGTRWHGRHRRGTRRCHGPRNACFSRSWHLCSLCSFPCLFLLRWSGKESGLLAVVKLPLVPQHDYGEAKDHPKNGAPNIVHEDFFSEELVNRVRRESGAVGTGSCPPAHQGWQRTSRATVR